MRALVVFVALRAAWALADEGTGIGYPTVAAALEALKARQDVTISVQGGWTIVQDPQSHTLWSFTPPGHPAHPAVVKRAAVEKDGKVFVQTRALCQASKTACDKLMAEFGDLNRQIGDNMRARSQITPESELRVEALGENSFRLTLKTFRSTSLEDGWAELLPKARELCGAKSVGYGRYEFEASEPLSTAPADKRFLLLKQQINCGAADPPPPAVSTANKDSSWRPNAAQAQLVERQSYAFFSARDKGDYQQAYAFFSPKQKATVSYDKWASQIETFNSRAGAPQSRKIKKITWYKDPPKTDPGIYAAVDFVSQFANVNIHCGYIVWHEQPDSSFLLVREQESTIDKETEQKLEPAKLEKIRAQIGC